MQFYLLALTSIIQRLKCNQTFSILTGTIFSRSQTSLTSWFYLIFRWINTKHGITSTDIAKELLNSFSFIIPSTSTCGEKSEN
ncbi:hypothetical protein [Spiroplasma ixodetis]|uniref:Uncharacterized protein n=1 Tax=Spiroplasma ixodetis TaxID=2141 RepID=A0ABM8BW14_9MOLU|nr:hypothetical protein [Spiroplasma ixodetis]BDT04046.1 hypothetical protein SHM_16920 [Spiroplasma ixodetis]